MHFSSGSTFHQISSEITPSILSLIQTRLCCIWNAVIIADCVLRVALEKIICDHTPLLSVLGLFQTSCYCRAELK